MIKLRMTIARHSMIPIITHWMQFDAGRIGYAVLPKLMFEVLVIVSPAIVNCDCEF